MVKWDCIFTRNLEAAENKKLLEMSKQCEADYESGKYRPFYPKEVGHHSDCVHKGPANTWIIADGHNFIHESNADLLRSLGVPLIGNYGDSFTHKPKNRFFGSTDERFDYVDLYQVLNSNKPEKINIPFIKSEIQSKSEWPKTTFINDFLDPNRENSLLNETIVFMENLGYKNVSSYKKYLTELPKPFHIVEEPKPVLYPTKLRENMFDTIEIKKEKTAIEIVMEKIRTYKPIFDATKLSENMFNVLETKKEKTAIEIVMENIRLNTSTFNYDTLFPKKEKTATIHLKDLAENMFNTLPKTEITITDLSWNKPEKTPVYLANQNHWLGGRNDVSTMNAWAAEVNTHYSPVLKPLFENKDTYIASFVMGDKIFNDTLKRVKAQNAEFEHNNLGWADFENNIYKRDMISVGKLSDRSTMRTIQFTPSDTSGPTIRYGSSR